jgi:hypothetical protein
MSWTLANTTTQIAQKEYHCEASDWITNGGIDERDFAPEDWKIIQDAQAEKWKILPGTRYVKTVGQWEGSWETFRAREDLDAICHKYKLYDC